MKHSCQTTSSMDSLLRSLKAKCKSFDIPLVGIADANRWKEPPFLPWMPKEFFPQSIFPEAKSVIVIGLPVTLPVLETSPSIFYRELYQTVNSLLDQYTYRLANFLNDQGYPSIFVPRDGYAGVEALLKDPIAFFSHRHAAFLAGLGTFGVNNMLLTPQYGPRVRFGSIFTAAELPSDPLLKEDLCTRCMRCVRMCPAEALDERDYPVGLTIKKNCADHSAELNRLGISPCGICIKVCPVGEDRKIFGREDMSIYKNKESFLELHGAWEHVRRYGKR
jgi:epoxyqueuosine reductase